MGCIELDYLFRDKPYNPAISISDYDTFNFVSEGNRLYGEIMWPDGSFQEGRPCVLLFHGFPGSARNDDLAHALCRAGCVVITPHHRGAWGSEGSYLPSHCVEDAVNLANYVRSPDFCRIYKTAPDRVFLVGHSMGGNTVLGAARRLPWLRGLILLTPFDPTRFLRDGDPERLQDLLLQSSVLQCDGPDAIYQDIVTHLEDFAFEGAFPALKDQNLCCVVGKLDSCAPADEIFLPLWKLLKARQTTAVQRYLTFPTGHGLLGCRISAIYEIAHFISDVLAAEAAEK